MFDEVDHPRGQPDNKGQFREKESTEQKLARAERIYNSDPPSTPQNTAKYRKKAKSKEEFFGEEFKGYKGRKQ